MITVDVLISVWLIRLNGIITDIYECMHDNGGCAIYVTSDYMGL